MAGTGRAGRSASDDKKSKAKGKGSKKKKSGPRAEPSLDHATAGGNGSAAAVDLGSVPPVDLSAVPGGRLVPVQARPSRSERAFAEKQGDHIDQMCSAWAAIVAERMAADQTFAETYEQYQQRTSDLRSIFDLEQLHAADAHLTLVNSVIARHLDGNRADPFAILADLREEGRRVAVVYAVNAFLAVLNQMNPNKPKWITVDLFDSRMAVLALAHQAIGYALESARILAPADLTEAILRAAQDDSVWGSGNDKSNDKSAKALAACAAAAAFFRELGEQDLSSMGRIIELYKERSIQR